MLWLNRLKTIALLAALTGPLMLVGYFLAGTNGMIIGFVLAFTTNFGSYWFSDRIAMAMAGAREVQPEEAPELHELVARLASAAGLPKPRVAIVESNAPNAFATGRNTRHSVVAVTTGILRILTRRELEAVISHELGHIRNRDTLVSSIAATIAGAITLFANLGELAVIFGRGRRNRDRREGELGALLMLIIAPLAAAIIQMAISRSREFGADETGAHVCGDPEVLASALRKLESWSLRIPIPVNPAISHLFIVKPLTGSSMEALFSTHPKTEARVARLRDLTHKMAYSPTYARRPNDLLNASRHAHPKGIAFTYPPKSSAPRQQRARR
jgi:heat shock protein HtpX